MELQYLVHHELWQHGAPYSPKGQWASATIWRAAPPSTAPLWAVYMQSIGTEGRTASFPPYGLLHGVIAVLTGACGR